MCDHTWNRSDNRLISEVMNLCGNCIGPVSGVSSLQTLDVENECDVGWCEEILYLYFAGNR